MWITPLLKRAQVAVVYLSSGCIPVSLLDIFGQLTYEMCALTVPFNAKNFQDLRREIVQSKPLSLSRYALCTSAGLQDCMACRNAFAELERRHTTAGKGTIMADFASLR